MAFSSRLLSKSRQLYGGHAILRQEHAIPVRFYAKEAAPSALKGDEMLKNIFLEVEKKFDTALGILRKEKITIDPDDPASVFQYAKVMKTVREKADLFSESQRIQYTIQTRTHDITDARTYLLTLKEVRIKRGLTDELGTEPVMKDALDKVEKEIKKPLVRNDKKSMALLTAKFDKINKKLGIRKEDPPKYEKQLDLKIAKAQLEEPKKDALEAMETQKNRLEKWKEDPPKYEKQLDLKIAKAQLEEPKKDDLESMETQKKQLEKWKEDPPKYEKQLDLKIAKAQLEEPKKDDLESVETQKKQLGIRKEDPPKYEFRWIREAIEKIEKDDLEARETQKKQYVSYDMMNLFPFYGVAPGTFVSWVVG